MPFRKEIKRMKIAVTWVVLGLLLSFYDPHNLAFQAFLGMGVLFIALMWKRLQFKTTSKINNHGNQ
jgi:hypothetical protein